MSSYVEKVLDFLERHTVHPGVPKQLQEDLEWAIDVISANKLYAGNSSHKLDETKPEIKAWIDLISLKNIPVNNEEKNRIIDLEKKWAVAEVSMKSRKTTRVKKVAVETQQQEADQLNK
jgi:hypothetical protein